MADADIKATNGQALYKFTGSDIKETNGKTLFTFTGRIPVPVIFALGLI